MTPSAELVSCSKHKTKQSGHTRLTQAQAQERHTQTSVHVIVLTSAEMTSEPVTTQLHSPSSIRHYTIYEHTR